MINVIFLFFVMCAGCAAMDLDNQGYLGSDKLGVAFIQSGKQGVQSTKEDRVVTELSVPPFAVLLPAGNAPIQICAGSSPSIFALSSPDNPACFARGSGMAMPKQPAEKGWVLNLSSGHGHNYFDSSRTVSGNRYRAVYINQIKGERGSKEIFLSIYTDKNGNKKVGQDEVEHFELVFSEDVISADSKDEGAKKRTDQSITEVFSRSKGELYRYYLDGLQYDPDLRGMMALKLTILPSGRVQELAVIKSTLNNKVLENSIASSVTGFDFGGGDYQKETIIYPLQFIPASNNENVE